MANNANARVRGTIFRTGTSGSAAATVLGNVRKVKNFPMDVADRIDITNVADTVKQRVAGDVDPGDAEIQCGFLKTDVATVKAMVGVDKSFGFTYSDGSKDDWEGFVESTGKEVEGDKGEVRMPVKMCISGPVTFTPAP